MLVKDLNYSTNNIFKKTFEWTQNHLKNYFQKIDRDCTRRSSETVQERR